MIKERRGSLPSDILLKAQTKLPDRGADERRRSADELMSMLLQDAEFRAHS